MRGVAKVADSPAPPFRSDFHWFFHVLSTQNLTLSSEPVGVRVSADNQHIRMYILCLTAIQTPSGAGLDSYLQYHNNKRIHYCMWVVAAGPQGIELSPRRQRTMCWALFCRARRALTARCVVSELRTVHKVYGSTVPPTWFGLGEIMEESCKYPLNEEVSYMFSRHQYHMSTSLL